MLAEPRGAEKFYSKRGLLHLMQLTLGIRRGRISRVARIRRKQSFRGRNCERR
jgi:hypothetical protein